MTKQGFFSFFSMNELLASPRLRPIIERLHPAAVIATVKGVYEDVTQEMFSAASERRIPELAELTDKIFARLQDVEEKGNALVIDADGVLFSSPQLAPSLGRAVLDEMIWRLDVPLAGFDGEESEPEIVEDEWIRKIFPSADEAAASLCSLVGAEDALFFSSAETAEIALFQTFGRKGNVVLARRDLYEDSDGHRLSERFFLPPERVREVGASNRAKIDDFSDVCGEETGLVWLAAGIHSDLRPTLDDNELSLLKEGTRPWRFPIVGQFDFAPILDLSDYLVDPIPTVANLLTKDYDLLLFRSGQLIGGPDCGVLIGSKAWLDPIRRAGFHDLFAPHRADLAGLAKTFALSRNREKAEMNIPILHMVSVSPANLRNRAERLLPQLKGAKSVADAALSTCETLLYPNAVRGRMNSVGLSVRSAHHAPSDFAALLKRSKPGITTMVKGDNIFIDLKTVPPRLDSVIVRIFENLV